MAGRVAEIVLPTGGSRDDIPVVTETPGKRLDPILLADDPREGVVSGHGNGAIEPPRLRHRVPHASGTVAAIGIPAGHVTTAECDMTLPKGRVGPDRRFVRRGARDAELRSFGMAAFVDRTAEIAADTGCLAGVNVARRGEGAPVWTVQDAGIRFTFGMAGSLVLKGEGRSPQRPVAGDAFAIPPGMRTRCAGRSDGVARYAGRSDGVERSGASRPGAVEPAVG